MDFRVRKCFCQSLVAPPSTRKRWAKFLIFFEIVLNDYVYEVTAIRARIALGTEKSPIVKISQNFCNHLYPKFEGGWRADNFPFLGWPLKSVIGFCLLGCFRRVKKDFCEVWLQLGFA